MDNNESRFIFIERELNDLQIENRKLREQVELLTNVIIEQHGDYFL